jgi:hypothetical protein
MRPYLVSHQTWVLDIEVQAALLVEYPSHSKDHCDLGFLGYFQLKALLSPVVACSLRSGRLQQRRDIRGPHESFN